MNILLLLALIPPIALLIYIWRVDKIEHEPIATVMKVLIFGALSGMVAGVIEQVLNYPISFLFGNNKDVYLIAENFIGVALVEEGVKMFVIMKVVWSHRDYDYMFDGIVYGAAASLGFAALENVLYAFSFGFETVLLRAITAIPGHTIFGVFMGFLISQAKCQQYRKNHGSKGFYLFMAIALPTILHGFYDYLLSGPFSGSDTIWLICLVIAAAGAFVVVHFAAKRDQSFAASKYM